MCMFGCKKPAIRGADGLCEYHHKRVVNHAISPYQIRQWYNGEEAHKWRALRAKFLRSKPICKLCGALGRVVDHIKPLSTPEGYARRLDITNLQSLCVRCHGLKTTRENITRRPLKPWAPENLVELHDKYGQ